MSCGASVRLRLPRRSCRTTSLSCAARWVRTAATGRWRRTGGATGCGSSRGRSTSSASSAAWRPDARRSSAGDPERAAAEFRAGLGMWRGPPLPELADTAEARVEIARIEERRLVALEGRVEADLARGRHAELIGELEAAVAREPLRERLRGAVDAGAVPLRAPAEALEVYRDGRRMLAERAGPRARSGAERGSSRRSSSTTRRSIRRRRAPATASGAAGRERARAGRSRLRPPPSCSSRRPPRAVLQLGGGGNVEGWPRDRGPELGRGDRPRDRAHRLRRPRSGRTRAASPPARARSGSSTATTGPCRASMPTTRRVTRTFAIGGVPTAVAVGGGNVWIGAGSRTVGSEGRARPGKPGGARRRADRRRLGRWPTRATHAAAARGREGVRGARLRTGRAR